MHAILQHTRAPVSTAFAIQAVGAAISIPRQTDLYFDAFGALGFLSATATSFAACCQRNRPPAARQILLSSLTCIWAIRLGIFLCLRVHKHGKDARFDGIKSCAPAFMGTVRRFACAALGSLFAVALASHMDLRHCRQRLLRQCYSAG
jgi:steroid 5-alpha reductase family enzyme